MRRFTFLIACIGLAWQAAAFADRSGAALERETRFGPVVGSDDSKATGTYSWKGVPFAMAPVGALRWKAPVDPEGWKKPRKTQQFGNACVQYGRIYGPGANNRYDPTIGTTLNQAVGSEDCLYLNIWTPADRRGDDRRDHDSRGDRDRGDHDEGDDGLPVIVFVHGGSNVSGYTADPVYDGAALARAANAVVVTVNYRLGIFGFLSVPQLKSGIDAQEDSGNFALLDVVKALKFIRHDIAEFGGDPRNVTLMGQSAGAINVYALLTTPATVDARPRLFHRAAPLSGGISLASNLPPGRLPTLNPASFYLAQGNQLLYNQVVADGLAPDVAGAAAWVASHTAAQVAAYLRGKPPATLLFTLLTKLAALGLAGSGPIPDGAMLPLDPIGAIAAGNYLHVPVMAGNTRDEGKLFPTFLSLLGGPSGRLVTDKQLFDIQFSYAPDAPPQIAIGQWIPAVYLPVTTPATGFNAKTELLNQIFLVAGANNALATLKSQQNDVWYYRFDWDEEPAPFNDIYGAAHAFDLPFLFANFGPSLFSNIANSSANRPGRVALSRAMMASLAAFARRGDPNSPAALGVTWPAWPAKLIFDATPVDKAISVQ
ncbi:MAG TPA: carboxylesterase family protein [Caldimonas sp.]|jgi:para-nitrobenzyl esterase|nr:carboxylesterase family protein [Caldimonas sp.]